MATPWLHDNPFSHLLTVSEQDIDALGHTNNNVYNLWCERVAWQHSDTLGIDASDYQKLDRAMVIQRAEYDYHLPAMQGDRLQIDTWLSPGTSRLTMQRFFQVTQAGTAKLLFQGKWYLVCVKLSSGKPIKMPEAFIKAYLSQL
jgi:acyl-CoA thioester hydrolase